MENKFLDFQHLSPLLSNNNKILKYDIYIYIYILSVYSPFSDRVGLPLHNCYKTQFQIIKNVEMKLDGILTV